MEWIIINDLFPEEITKINNSLIPPHFIGDAGNIRRTQDNVKRVLDQLGQLSAEEQGLSRVITTAEKLRTADGHVLYLLKDATANSGAGEAVGLLKVGHKHLFLFDDAQTVHEVEPLCVLDFYLRKTHQRRGLGKKLFDYMLQDQHTSAERLAVDGPSSNMRAFLAKNYHIPHLIKQPNNFAVSPQFFGDLPAAASGQRKYRAEHAAGTPPVGRFTARHPPSTMGNVIHGDVDEQPSGEGGEKCQRARSGAPTPASSPQGAGARAAGLASGGDPQRPSSLAVAPAPAAPFPAPATPAGTPSRRDSQLTDKGFFDVKFHHMKLW